MTHVGTALIDPYKIFEKIALAKGTRVADLGCGRTGHFVFPASKIVGDTGVVYAVDVVKDILESIQSRARSEGFDNVQTVWSDIEMAGKTTIPAESLDVCFLVNVMFLLNKKEEAIKEARRLLKNDGVLCIVDWQKRLGETVPSVGELVKPETLVALAEANGFKKTDDLAPGEYHYCLIFKKS